MLWHETIASRCRYGDIAGRIFGDAEIVCERSEDDYQGCAKVLARLRNGDFILYEWTYGSCSGCDDWDARDLSADAIEVEMRRDTVTFNTIGEVERYFNIGDPLNDVRYIGDDFRAMRDAFIAWLRERNLR